jgi:uncharacterized protein
MDKVIQHITNELQLPLQSVSQTIKLLEEGNTIPFITRYRKEMTGGLDEEKIRGIEEHLKYQKNLNLRKEEILVAIEEQGKRTPELEQQIAECLVLARLEDIYLPFKKKRKTRAMTAKEKGFDPLAQAILEDQPLSTWSAFYLNESEEEALSFARDILAEQFSEQLIVREFSREFYWKKGLLESEKTEEEVENAATYRDYFEFEEEVEHCPPHRILAINRGENEKVLRVKVRIPEELFLEELFRICQIQGNSLAKQQAQMALKDGFKRLLHPSMERDTRNRLKDKAHEHSIQLFKTNLRNLLLQPPVRGKRILALDPGFRTGCKYAGLDEFGTLLETGVLYPHNGERALEQAKSDLKVLIVKYRIDCIPIGNGTACRETESFVAEVLQDLNLPELAYTIVDESGASVYSVSTTAKQEFPELDATSRGTISIGRRLQDPLAELVKVDPRSLGVGMYQHDMPPAQLSEALEGVVESCVNYVGVDLNSASMHLLLRVAGLNKKTSREILKFREEHGAFRNRLQLLEVKGIGAEAFLQAAGFLRIRDGETPLDNTSIHPESYPQTQALLQSLKVDEKLLGTNRLQLILNDTLKRTNKNKLANELKLGLPTLEDILENLKKPGRDPREDLPKPVFKKNVLHFEDLQEGMELTGVVRNVIDFGAFVDIGVHQDGLVHVSQMRNGYVSSPTEVVQVGDVIQVKVLSIDKERKRIALSMKGLN